MKKLLLSLVLVLGMAFSASGAVKEFSNLKVDVPDGWTAQENDGVVALIAPQNVAAISFTLQDAQGATGEQLAEAFAEQLNASKPEVDDGVYIFRFATSQGLLSTSVLSCEDNQYFLLTMTGQHDAFSDIIDSIEEK